jgi:hypothetical protein
LYHDQGPCQWKSKATAAFSQKACPIMNINEEASIMISWSQDIMLL